MEGFYRGRLKKERLGLGFIPSKVQWEAVMKKNSVEC